MRSMLGNSFTTRFRQSPWITGAGRRSKGFWHRETVKELIGPYCHCQEKAQPGSLQTNRKSLLTIIRRHEKTQYNAEWQNTDDVLSSNLICPGNVRFTHHVKPTNFSHHSKVSNSYYCINFRTIIFKYSKCIHYQQQEA